MGESRKEKSHTITFVVGPTASGKSFWALQEAERYGGAIVNADSIQIFKHLKIGAAKPTESDMKKVPHLLYDIIEPNCEFTAGDYRRAALKVIEENIESRPLYFVGGSGFYLQALEKGMYDVKPVSNEIRLLVKQYRDQAALFAELIKVDAESAERIGESDPYRLERALELVLSEGRTIQQIEADFRQKHKLLGEIYSLKKVGLNCDRGQLRRRVLQRTEAMLKQGFVAEVESLIQMGYGDTKPLRSVGYKEVLSFLHGDLSQDELTSAIVTSTMQLAKKQMTWFKRDHAIEWFESSQIYS